MPQIDRISLEDAVRVAIALHKEGHLEEAEMVYGDVLKVAPEQPDALHFLGVLKHQLGQGHEGIEYVRRALEILPGDAGMQLNFGNINRDLRNFDAAESAYRKAISIAGDSADAYCNLGSLCRAQKRFEEAKPLFEKAIELDPWHAEAYHNLGNLLKEQKDFEGAIETYTKAIELTSSQRSIARSSANLASLLRRSGRLEESERVLRQWLVRDPASATAAHMLAALTGVDVPSRASDEYIRSLFDAFANSFDEVLETLHYRAPKLIDARLGELFEGASADPLSVLDVGCGTGLAGELTRPRAKHLVGVDLSAVMLEHARRRGIYDELVEAEATEYLRGQRDRFDLVISADTFCYFGDLSGLLGAVAEALTVGGALCFTVESTETSAHGNGYQLGFHGRYAHQKPYVENLLAELGFDSVVVENAVLRLEAGQPVAGHVVSARKAR